MCPVTGLSLLVWQSVPPARLPDKWITCGPRWPSCCCCSRCCSRHCIRNFVSSACPCLLRVGVSTAPVWCGWLSVGAEKYEHATLANVPPLHCKVTHITHTDSQSTTLGSRTRGGIFGCLRLVCFRVNCICPMQTTNCDWLTVFVCRQAVWSLSNVCYWLFSIPYWWHSQTQLLAK